ncbi:MAG TPA: class I SAM-dependent methyltransferase [Gaiellaceae bacterium]|nr:class I SAM-dependent methyltransferase [Gaiellaceae bacterium]
MRRAVFKTVIGPRRYRAENGYDAQRFWSDRFRKHGTALRGSGDEGLSEAQNELVYERAGATLLEAVRRAGVDLPRARVLDVGSGPGFFTGLLHAEGVASYTGIDITEELFADLRKRFPDYEFVRKDVTSAGLEGTFDLVMMIDVAEHIVDTDAFDRCIANLTAAVAPGGTLLIGPLLDRSGRHLFYVRLWSREDVRDRLPTFDHLEDLPFRNGFLSAFRRPP